MIPRDTIVQMLRQIEAEHNVRVLLAVESGSRAWGFESPDSDYDVRFIYVRPRDEYLRLQPHRDVIEWQLDEVLDINGWDVTKALRLLKAGNTTLYEWAHSPIVYEQHDAWQQIAAVLPDYFQPSKALYHYLSTAKGNYERNVARRDEVKLKKYFYVLRPLLAAEWVVRHRQPAPMRFEELLVLLTDERVRQQVMTLLEQKMAQPEVGMGPRIDEIDRYIEASLQRLQQQVAAMKPSEELPWQPLDEALLAII